MIKKVNIKNMQTNETVDIDMLGDLYILDEIDIGQPSVTFNTYKVPFQIGETENGLDVGTRNITIYGYVVADTSEIDTHGMKWKEYYALQEQQIEEAKQLLDKMISIYEKLTITINGYMIDAKPSIPVIYSSNYSENNEVQCKFEIDLICFSSMFYSGTKQVNLAYIRSNFHFPFHSTDKPPEEPIVFGEIMRRQSVSIENNGDAPVGCEITIKATAGVIKDPKIYNVNTGAFIGFKNVTLETGDYIIINTEVNKETAYKHTIETGQDELIVGDMLDGSEFLTIEKGKAFYAYSVEEQYQNNIEVFIQYSERYFNIKGM